MGKTKRLTLRRLRRRRRLQRRTQSRMRLRRIRRLRRLPLRGCRLRRHHRAAAAAPCCKASPCSRVGGNACASACMHDKFRIRPPGSKISQDRAVHAWSKSKIRARSSKTLYDILLLIARNSINQISIVPLVNSQSESKNGQLAEWRKLQHPEGLSDWPNPIFPA